MGKRRTLITVINTLVFSKLFNCSNMLTNPSKSNIDKLQCVQDFAYSIIVSGAWKYDHITSILKCLKWLLVSNHFCYCSAILAFKFMTGCAPKYVSTIFTNRLISASAPPKLSTIEHSPL